MNQQSTDRPENELPDDILQQAIASMATETVPAGPPPALNAATLRRLAESDQPARRSLPLIFRTRIMKFAAIAASLLVVTSLLALWVPTVESPAAFGHAFGEALKQVREAHSMSYVQEMTIEGKKDPIITKDFIAEDGRKRSEMQRKTHGHTTIFDTTGFIRLTLTEHSGPHSTRSHRMAHVYEPREDTGINSGLAFLSWLERLKDRGDKPDKELGKRELDGHQVTGFVVTEGHRTFTMWIDSGTGELVRIEYDSQVNGAAAHTIMKDFHFHQVLDESLFSFDVPPGYEIYGRPKDGKIEPPAGLELAWSKKGNWSGVTSTLGRPTVCVLEQGGSLNELNSGGEVIATFKLGSGRIEPGQLPRTDRAGALRASNLVAGQPCAFLVYRTWGHKVEAYSADGELLWSYAHQGSVDDDWAVNDVCPADLDGDGLDEVIIGYNGHTGLHVLDSQGQLLWKNTDQGNVWHVAAGDVDGAGRMEALATSSSAVVRAFDAKGKELRGFDPGFFANMVRTWRPAAERHSLSESSIVRSWDMDKHGLLIVAGSGKENVPLAALDSNGKTQWSLEFPASIANAVTTAERPWLAISQPDGNVRVLDLAFGKEIAHLGGQGGKAEVAWLSVDGADPLLIIAANEVLQAYRITFERP